MDPYLGQQPLIPKSDTFQCDSSSLERFKCSRCDFEADLTVTLHSHFAIFHEEKEIRIDINKILKCYLCSTCDFQTYSLLVFYAHISNCKQVFAANSELVRSWERIKIEHGYAKADEDCENYTCKIHMEGKPVTKDKKCFRCILCLFETECKNCLYEHRWSKHFTSYRYTCGLCPFKAKSIQLLKNHIMVHRGGLKCERCMFVTQSESFLRQHKLQSHKPQAVQWFKCVQCGFKGTRRSELEVHKLIKHSNVWYKL